MILTDTNLRTVNYLRISVTDRCNLRCLYCSSQDKKLLPHSKILNYKDFIDIISIAQDLGINKVRCTGGEPFIRKDFPEFIGKLLEHFPSLDVRITTNATLLAPHLNYLHEHGLKRLNVSLDTLDPSTFARITGHNLFDKVYENILKALAIGLSVKINTVAMKGVNDRELCTFLNLLRIHPIDIRFIEFMPMRGSNWRPETVWTAQDILKQVKTMADITPLPRERTDDGPAMVFSVAGALGRFGIISPLTNHFCHTCNKLRLTADGYLRTCLFSDLTYRLNGILQHKRLGPKAVRKVILMASMRKPLGHNFLLASDKMSGVCSTSMHTIGG